VTVNPRSGALVQLTVTTRMRPDGADGHAARGAGLLARSRPAEPLLTDAEAAVLVGPVIRTTAVPGPGGLNMIVKGRDGTMSLVVTGGGIASFNEMIGRRTGTRLAGVGGEAWLLNRRRTVVARVGSQLIKLTVSNRGSAGHPGRLPAIAAVAAARLADRARRGSAADQLPMG